MQMETTVVKEQALEKQIGGCMSGFFNIFDRPHLLSPKRFALPKRLSSSSSSSSSPLTSKTAQFEPSSSPLDSENPSVYSTPELLSPALDENLHITSELKQGSSRSPWRFSKEAPRLSLDSRAVVDAKGSLKPRQIRMDGSGSGSGSGSPSVIARLMGLEALPAAQPLQRSASESRVSREYRFVDSFNFQNPQCRDDEKSISNSTGGGEDDPAAEFHIRSGRAQPGRAPPPPPVPQRYVVRRKSFFDSADFFPEPRQTNGFYSHAPTTDLETLKQLLEALRLKGLLHSSSSSTNKHQGGIGNKNLVHQSPIKPPIGITSVNSTGAGASPSRRDQSKGRRRSRSENSVKSPNRGPTLKERSVPSGRRLEPVQTRNRINRGGRGPIEDDQCSEEMWKVDEYKRQGKTLLERCDKLLHSIAEMAASEAAGDSQPSPVSVLDAWIYNDESSPSPVMKRSLDFTESEDELWGGSMSSSSDSEYLYISDILRASDCLPQECDIFSLLEKKQQYLKGKCTSAQERRLIFDAVQEIVGRIRRLPPWIMVGDAEPDKMQLIWSEFQKIRNKSWSTEEEDLVGYVCGVLGRDLSEDSWRDCQVEMSEAVLDIERLVFKDLIGETIRHMAALNRSGLLRRRLLF